MDVVKLIQHIDVSNHQIKNVRLELNPSFTGNGLVGKFGIDSLGAISYIAGYNGTVPVVNKLKELEVENFEDIPPLLTLSKNTSGFKDTLGFNMDNLVLRLFKDDLIQSNTTWSSERISEYVNNRLNIPIQDETLTPVLTREDLNILYPETEYGIGTTVFSETQGIQYTKISATIWKFEEIEIR